MQILRLSKELKILFVFENIYLCIIIHLFSDCTLTWFAVRRPYDLANSISTSLYVVAIIVEDFLPSISTTVRLSSVPLQMLIYVYKPITGACSIKPNITGDRPNRACIG